MSFLLLFPLFLFTTYTYAQELPDSSAIPVLTVTHTDVLCNGGNDGSITVTASGGQPPYRYSKDKGYSWQQTASFDKLSTGNYTLIAMDGNGQTASATVAVKAPSPITATIRITHVSCYGKANGTITVQATGGSGNFMYSKDKGVTWQPSARFKDLGPGDYGVLARDQHGCLGGQWVTITEPPAFTMRTEQRDASCYAYSDGSIRVDAQGGIPPYQYSNNNGLSWQETPLFNGISAGEYPLLVKDSTGCLLSSGITLQEPPLVKIDSVTAIFDNPAYSSIIINATGGIPAYAYTIYPGRGWQPAARFDTLPAGSYAAYVKDQHQCGSTLNITLASTPALQMKIESWSAGCYQSPNAAINIYMQGGAAPYRYSADSGLTWQSNANFLRKAGVYQVVVMDASANRVGAKVTLTEPSQLTARLEGEDISCRGASNGSINVIASGGIMPYKYSINKGATWQSSASFVGLPGGGYTILIRDRNSCETSAQLQLTEPERLGLKAQSIAATCYGKPDGRITLTSSGGTPPYQYSKDLGKTWEDAALFTQLSAGVYRIQVRDHNGCEDSVQIQVQQPLQISANPAVQMVSCYGAGDGRIILSPKGGTAPYTYRMDNGEWQTANNYSPLAPGLFPISIKDSHGCIQSANVRVTQPDSLELALVYAKNGCSYIGGQLEVKAGGGTQPYTYTLAGTGDSSSNGTFAALAAGRYNPVVTDKNGCTATAPAADIEISPELRLILDEKQDMQCDGIHKGGARLHAEGGSSPLRFTINEQAYAPGSNTGPLDNGPYTALVTDKNGCAAVQRFDINLLNEGCELTMPTGFSPNDDGLNDVFRPALYGNIRAYQLQLFNAWGNLLFSSNDPATGWDGTFKGHRQAVASYVWIARYTNYLGQPVVRSGVVTLVR
ncbi:gliding motility-associated C-terminal domain-containing protein [Chitinophaga agrisoli]|nr:gliding motility-associated C-terminal domain-containing protein [Chitinophaga agrisoli]